MVYGLWFMVYGLWFRVSGFGVRAHLHPASRARQPYPCALPGGSPCVNFWEKWTLGIDLQS
ncbi:hypothetical protein T484DRAFT_2646804 [Baffinella frigidus]|nr:hypothetical protein T484DRAFT_2646804 [Cryptophyta sp. CCMP2293]